MIPFRIETGLPLVCADQEGSCYRMFVEHASQPEEQWKDLSVSALLFPETLPEST